MFHVTNFLQKGFSSISVIGAVEKEEKNCFNM